MPSSGSSHAECSTLSGDCCPTVAGKFLDCCSQAGESIANTVLVAAYKSAQIQARPEESEQAASLSTPAPSAEDAGAPKSACKMYLQAPGSTCHGGKT